MSRHDDFPRPKEVADHGIRYGLALFVVLVVLGIAGFAWKVATAPARMAGDIVEQVFDADHALQSYRWFHGAYNQIEAKKRQIGLSKQALEASREDRKEARRVELLGLQQSCQTLVGQYNERATRADTVIFKHPDRFLPGDWPGESRVLPQTIDFEVCL